MKIKINTNRNVLIYDAIHDYDENVYYYFDQNSCLCKINKPNCEVIKNKNYVNPRKQYKFAALINQNELMKNTLKCIANGQVTCKEKNNVDGTITVLASDLCKKVLNMLEDLQNA